MWVIKSSRNLNDLKKSWCKIKYLNKLSQPMPFVALWKCLVRVIGMKMLCQKVITWKTTTITINSIVYTLYK